MTDRLMLSEALVFQTAVFHPLSSYLRECKSFKCIFKCSFLGPTGTKQVVLCSARSWESFECSPRSPSCPHYKPGTAAPCFWSDNLNLITPTEPLAFCRFAAARTERGKNLRLINIHENTVPRLPRAHSDIKLPSNCSLPEKLRLWREGAVLGVVITHSRLLHFMWRWVMLIYFSSHVVSCAAAPQPLISTRVKCINWSAYTSIISHLPAALVWLWFVSVSSKPELWHRGERWCLHITECIQETSFPTIYLLSLCWQNLFLWMLGPFPP